MVMSFALVAYKLAITALGRAIRRLLYLNSASGVS